MSIRSTREYFKTVNFTRAQMSNAHRAQEDAVHAIDSRSSQAAIRSNLVGYGATLLGKIFSSVVGSVALALYSSWATVTSIERQAYRRALYGGQRSMSHMLQQFNQAPSILEIQVRVPVLELTLSNGSTVTYTQGNASNPSRGYTLLRVRYSSGWVDM